MIGPRKPEQTCAEKLAAEARKARALSDDEIMTGWNACEGRGSFGNLVRLLLLAGARRGEIAKLARDQIQSERLVLPPLSTKTGEQHEVPLTELMRTVIAAQPPTLSELVFPLVRTGGVFNDWTNAVAALQHASGVDFTLHDLRVPAAR